ncbi:MAG: hypothetical protein GQ533_11735, partial [Methanosarcinaceae archaeon]|nr:hypothetical protein [Methanosarcinaceae archaeon]
MNKTKTFVLIGVLLSVLLLTAPAMAADNLNDIIINEIMYAPPDAAWGGVVNEWIELYNNDTEAINITGWVI